MLSERRIDQRQHGTVKFTTLFGRNPFRTPEEIVPALFPRIAFAGAARIVGDEPVLVARGVRILAGRLNLRFAAQLDQPLRISEIGWILGCQAAFLDPTLF